MQSSNRGGSPWHAGEREIQQRLGVAERMETFGKKIIRDFMPDQHRQFYAQLPFLVVGAVDDAGDAWATMLGGTPGFMSTPDARTLTIAARARQGDRVAHTPAQSHERLGRADRRRRTCGRRRTRVRQLPAIHTAERLRDRRASRERRPRRNRDPPQRR